MILYGASGHAKVIIEILENAGIPIVGLFDDNPNIQELSGYGCTPYNPDVIVDNQLIISVGDNRTRKLLAEKIGLVQYGKAIDIHSNVSKRTVIGNGCVIMPGATINAGTILGEHVIVNTNASVDHDCVIDSIVHISPGCSISGNVKIGEGTHIGTGTSIIQDINIGRWCIIGAGSTIIRNIPDFSVVVGNPGRLIRKTNANNEI
jgi:sugar O-acyltransferase (sialic acid O-acetyltransferase NeuD family)